MFLKFQKKMKDIFFKKAPWGYHNLQLLFMI